RVPFQLGLEADGNVAQMAQARAAMPNLDWRRGIGAALDAVQEIAYVVVARVILFSTLDIFGPNALRGGKKVLTHVIDTDESFGPFKDAPHRRLGCEAFHDCAVRIFGAKERMGRRREQAAL